jgi:hypothetical protein
MRKKRRRIHRVVLPPIEKMILRQLCEISSSHIIQRSVWFCFAYRDVICVVRESALDDTDNLVKFFCGVATV